MSNKRPPLDFEAIKIASHGKWLDTIFPAVGIQFAKAPKQHQPCPVCGGTDRFRCDNKKGSGSFFCSHCGAGDGFKLVELYTNVADSYELMKMVGGILGVGATSTITPEQRAKWKAEQQAKEQAEREAKIQRQNATAMQAVERWNKASMTGQSDYLTRKQIMPFEARFDGQKILIPIVAWLDNQQVLRNIQTIMPSGDKLFMSDGQVKGCYCPIGQAHQFTMPEVVFVCEGWATGASIYMAVNQSIPVFVAFNAGNLLDVGQVVRSRYPKTRIIFCADNDSETEKKTDTNTGVVSAMTASKAVGGEVVIPVFDMVNDKDKAVA